MANQESVGQVIASLQGQLETQNELERIENMLKDIPKKKIDKQSNAAFITKYNKAYQEELKEAIRVLQDYMIKSQGLHLSDVDDEVEVKNLEMALDNIWEIVRNAKAAHYGTQGEQYKKLVLIEITADRGGFNRDTLRDSLKTIVEVAKSECSTTDKTKYQHYQVFFAVYCLANRELKG